MQLPQIRIQATQARLNLEIHKPVQEIQQEPAELKIKQPPADLSIKTTPGKLTIDQTLAWENLDLKSPAKRVAEFAQQGNGEWAKGVNRLVTEGNELMKIENGGNPIVSQAKRKMVDSSSFHTGSTPSAFSVKLQYDPGNVTIDWKVNSPIIDVEINKPTHNYTPGSVTGYVSPMASLHIDFVG